jgi:hypothetical protein
MLFDNVIKSSQLCLPRKCKNLDRVIQFVNNIVAVLLAKDIG